MRARFILNLELQATVTRADLQNYVLDAVSAWKGQFHPSNPLRSLIGVRVKDESSGESADWQDDDPFYFPDYDEYGEA